jgi:hypothetical protein
MASIFNTTRATPALSDVAVFTDVSDTAENAVGSVRGALLSVWGGLLNHGVCNGRLTLESGVAISTTDQTAKTNVYFTPYQGSKIGLYSGTEWKVYAFTELTLALGTLTSGKNYDVFCYDNSGTLTLESLAWTSDTARATALVAQDGVWVKTGATTRRYLGTFRTVSTTTTELVFGGADTAARIYLWNAQNRVPVAVRTLDSTNSYAYNSSTIRQRNGSANNQINVLQGLTGESAISLIDKANAAANSGTVGAWSNLIGYDSTTAAATGNLIGRMSGAVVTGNLLETHSFLNHSPAVGYHYYASLEAGNGTDTVWYGDANAPTIVQTGLTGQWSY